MSLLSTVVIISCVFYGFFFFKQKTAYEMRISDWSSDVCSSDLRQSKPPGDDDLHGLSDNTLQLDPGATATSNVFPLRGSLPQEIAIEPTKIGRASCRERVCQYV